MSNVFKALLSILFFLNSGITPLFAQPTQPIQLDKPEKYKNKQLGSEKTGEKKFKTPRRFIQNTVTHYNWYYNANTKLNLILERAKMAHTDNFNELLSFYPYSLEITRSDSLDLDSVITKSSTGILVHDLRNDWIDNLFLLIGQAYYYKAEFDSAYRTFQYINYTYSPRDKNDYRVPVGSNASEGGNALKISTPESNSLPKKLFALPPSRNDALLWQIKSLIAKKDFGSASGMIEILRNDPEFPKRLGPFLAEMQAWYYYELNIPDSAAYYLEKALPNASTRNEMARWEYLIGQLYEHAGKRDEARKFYEFAIKHTTNPVLEVYARLASLKQHPGDALAVEEQLTALLKMGKRDKYIQYRDVIYYAAAQIEMDRGNWAQARTLLKKAASAKPNPNFTQSRKSSALLALGDMAYADGEFREAGFYYESISPSDPAITDPVAFSAKLNQLQHLISNYDIIRRQDSLQRLAAMPEAERDKFLQDEVKRYRKLAGIEESKSSAPSGKNQETSDLFGQKSKGEWYFYNQSLKSRGYNEFIAKWGNRDNTDNWRRGGLQRGSGLVPVQGTGITDVENPYSYEALLAGIPLTAEKFEQSNDSIASARLNIARIFFENLEDYNMVIKTLESFHEEHPYSGRLGEALYYLYFSYVKIGREDMATRMRELLIERFEGSPFEKQVNMAAAGHQPEDPGIAIQQKYEDIYNLFIEGRFAEAFSEKAVADSLYGNHYWTPQLLYIESVYHIRQRNDNRARQVLSQLINRFANHPMKEKAETMLNVLNRRRDIENYLTKLEISLPEEEDVLIYQPKAAESLPEVPKAPVQKEVNAQTQRKEAVKGEIEAPTRTGELPLTKITPPVVEPKDTMSREEPETEITRKDSMVTEVHVLKAPPLNEKNDSLAINLPQPPAGKIISGAFEFEKNVPHMVVIVMDKVDPVYISESRNAFNLYNRSRASSAGITIENHKFSDTLHYVILRGFKGSDDALNYASIVEKEAPVSVIPWLPKGKYSFMVISEKNLSKLVELGNLEEYREFEAKFLPRTSQ